MVNPPICELQLPVAFFLAADKGPVENSAVCSGLGPSSALHVTDPFPVVTRAVVAYIQADPVRLVVFSISLVSIPVWVGYFALSLGLVVFPLPLVLGAIRPQLYAETLPLLAYSVNLASVDASVIVLDGLDRVSYPLSPEPNSYFR